MGYNILAKSSHIGRAGRDIDPASLAALLQGFRFLTREICPMGIQSWISSDPAFPREKTTASSDVLHGELSRRARCKFVNLGGGQPENFTSFLLLKMLGPVLGRAALPIVRWSQDKFVPSRIRYHFFRDPDAIAADTDCSGVALVGLYRVGAISRSWLRMGAEEILRSAAAESIPAERNRAYGKDNGSVIKGVFKVYWEDEVQEEAALRGRKHDPTSVANALHAVLLAVRDADLSLDGTVRVTEFREDGSQVSRELSRRYILYRNIAFMTGYLQCDSFAEGTRYYPSPDAFLCFASELLREFPDELESLRAPMRDALSRRWRAVASEDNDPGDPRYPINLAMRVIAAHNIDTWGESFAHQMRVFQQLQDRVGAWPAGALFKLGSLDYYFGSDAMTTMFALQALLMDCKVAWNEPFASW